MTFQRFHVLFLVFLTMKCHVSVMCEEKQERYQHLKKEYSSSCENRHRQSLSRLEMWQKGEVKENENS